MGTRLERDRAPLTLFTDRCAAVNMRNHCGGPISHWQRTKPNDYRDTTDYGDRVKVYTVANRPRYRRCYECAAKLHAAGAR